MSVRSFKNDFFNDYTAENAKKIIKNKKLLPNEDFKKYEKSVWETLDNIKNVTTDFSIYTGSGGLALLKWFKSRKSDDPTRILLQAKKLAATDRLLAGEKLNKRRVTFLCGDAGPLALGAVICYHLGEETESRKLIERLLAISNEVVDTNYSMLPNELLFGRVGYLYALLFVKKYIGSTAVMIEERLIRRIIKIILALGKREAKLLKLKDTPLMYTWHDKPYLGAAHGLAGILFIILQARPYVDKVDLDFVIKPAIDYLANVQFVSGNFPSSVGKNADKLVQWCHGAPGLVQLFCIAFKVFGEERYLQIALQCGEVVWERGLLTKGYSLCHGVAGNAYTFIQLFKTTQDEKHLYRAYKFAEWCVQYTPDHELHKPDRPMSLYEGLAGRLYFIMDVQDPMNAKFPAFEV